VSSSGGVIITGVGRAFCAGDDVKQILAERRAAAEAIETRQETAGSRRRGNAFAAHRHSGDLRRINVRGGLGNGARVRADIRVVGAR
jgi:hypothetical protein